MELLGLVFNLGIDLFLNNTLNSNKCNREAIHRVVYRKLKVKRTEQFYEQFEDFVQRNMGRKYNFSVKKFIMNR